MGLSWPSTLPRPMLDGYSTSPGVEIARTEMESGEARARRRTVSAPDTIKLSWLLDASQMAIFRAYWDAEMAAGAAWCDMPVDVGDGVEQKSIRAIGQYTAARISGSYWKVSCEVEVRKLRSTVFDYLNLMGLPSLDLDFARTQSLNPVITSSRQVAPSVSFSRASTATYFGADGLLKTAEQNEPRFDFDPITLSCKGLLIEEERTNLLTYAEQIDNSVWAKQQMAATAINAATAPDGTMTAEGMVPNTTSTGHYFDRNITGLVAAENYCLSAFFKQGSCRDARLQAFGTGNAMHGVVLNFDIGVTTFISSAEYTSGGGVTTSFGAKDCGNGWWYLWVAGYPDAAATNRLCRSLLTNSSGLTLFAGNGVTPAVYVWGGQLEAGSFPTSYIPTTTTIATRKADLATMSWANFVNWYRQDEGAFSVSGRVDFAGGSSRCFISADDGTANERHQIRFNGVSAQSTICVDGGVVQASPSSTAGSFTVGATHVTAYGYKNNDVNGAMDGVVFAKDTSGQMPAPSQLQIGRGANSSALNGHVSRILFFPQRISDSQLQALSS